MKKLVFIFILFASVVQADGAVTRQTHQRFIDDYIVVHLQNFKQEATALENEISRYCFAAPKPQLAAVQQQFIASVKAWMPLVSMRFDAFEKNSRDLRVYFWPNSRGEKQAGKFLHAMDMSKLAEDYFPKLSVALQGLPIVEWLLYHKDSTLFAADVNLRQYSCHYMQAIGNNLETISDELIVEFGIGGDARQALLNPSASNELYGELPEVTLQFYKAVHAMVELVHGQKLSRPIGKEIKHLRPKRLEMWRSGQSRQNLRANIVNIYEAYKIFSPMVLKAAQGEQIDADVKQAFDQTIILINALPEDFYERLTDDNKAKIWQQSRELIQQLEVLKDLLAIKITEALGIPLGFNALDGD